MGLFDATPMRFARRELRGGLKGFRIFLACLTLGAAAIAGVGSLTAAVVEGLRAEGQSILGGDAELRLSHREAAAEETAWLAARGDLSRTIEMRAMARARATDERGLVELKGVDEAYPLYGDLRLAEPGGLQEILAQRVEGWGAAVEAPLIGRFGVQKGDRIRIGEQDYVIRAVIENEPDRVADGMTLAPRVMVSRDSLAGTGLIRIGSLIRYYYRLRLPPGADAGAFVDEINEAFPDAGWRVRSRDDGAPGVRRFVERVGLFLTLVGLTALVVGGVGVGNAVRGYMDEKRETIATLKCLGAEGGTIFATYLVQVLALSLVGVAAGVVLGAGLPIALAATLSDLLPVPARFGIYPGPLVLAAAFGIVTAVCFAIWPLARARDVPAAGLFRDIVAPTRRFPRAGYLVAMAIAALGLIGGAVLVSDDKRFAIYFVGAAVASFVVLLGTAAGIVRLARRMPRPRRPDLRLAIANLHRPGAATPSVVLSLGLGLTLLVAIALIDGNLRGQVSERLATAAPTFFFLDIQPDEVARFEEIVAEAEGATDFERVPMLRGRLVALNGVPASEAVLPPEAQWALRGDRGLTYSAVPPTGARLVAGEWWPRDYSGPPLLSFDAELARNMGLGVGDTLTVNVLGRDITATIANLREIDWSTMGINFILVFAPGVLENAPHTHLATVRVPDGTETEFYRRITNLFPTVTVVRMKEAFERVNGIFNDLSNAVRGASVVTLAAGILVLAGAMAAGHRGRVYDAVILKVLGATRRRVLAAYLFEYAILGLVTALIASVAGSAAAYAVITELMDAEWIFLPGTLATTIIAGVVATVILGLIGTWSALGQKAAPVLRAQ